MIGTITTGLLSPTQQTIIVADYLVVAGGAGGAVGGGGAGGLRSTVTATGGGGSLESQLTLNIGTGYTVTIGAGGARIAGNTNPAALGSYGNPTTFGPVTSQGGGGGGIAQGYTPGSGGTGGGGTGEIGQNNGYVNTSGTDGGVNTGGGSGGGRSGPYNSPTGNAYLNGGSGVVILRYPNTKTITIGAGLTGTTATDGSFKVTSITAGTGNVSWA